MKLSPIASLSAAAALAIVGFAVVAGAEPAKPPEPEKDDPELSPRMQQLKRLRAQLAQLQAEIPRSSNARRLEIDVELQQLDAQLAALLASPAVQAEGFEWLPVSGDPVAVRAGDTYAAVVQLGWLASIFVSASLIESKLREAAQWFTLEVAAAPIKGSGIPWTTKQTGGRYWILGAPTQARLAPRPAQLLKLFVRRTQ